jgi:hypothetical protein
MGVDAEVVAALWVLAIRRTKLRIAMTKTIANTVPAAAALLIPSRCLWSRGGLLNLLHRCCCIVSWSLEDAKRGPLDLGMQSRWSQSQSPFVGLAPRLKMNREEVQTQVRFFPKSKVGLLENLRRPLRQRPRIGEDFRGICEELGLGFGYAWGGGRSARSVLALGIWEGLRRLATILGLALRMAGESILAIEFLLGFSLGPRLRPSEDVGYIVAQTGS